LVQVLRRGIGRANRIAVRDMQLIEFTRLLAPQRALALLHEQRTHALRYT